MGTPVLPVAHNAGWLWPKGVLGKRPGVVTLSIGAPIPSAGKDPGALTQEVERWIEAEVERLGNPSGHASRRTPRHGAMA
jgi:1-acyl-sn-glycerol-3-phosphate acyltransferase